MGLRSQRLTTERHRLQPPRIVLLPGGWIRHARIPRSRALSAVLLMSVGVALLQGCARKQALPLDGAALFTQKCESCHRPDNDMRAPEPAALKQMSKASILAALDSGRMRWQGKFLSQAKKTAIAEYLGAPDIAATPMTGFCARDLDPPANPPGWSGWGGDLENSRFQPAPAAGLNRDQIKSLKFKWAFGFPGAAATFGQPTSSAGRLFVGSEDGTVYALDSATGCLWWSFKASATVKTAISIGNKGSTAFFGDTNGVVYALKAADGSVPGFASRRAHYGIAAVSRHPIVRSHVVGRGGCVG
jgi:polyvinyl alcohol dehydrogenase (cytochrome)